MRLLWAVPRAERHLRGNRTGVTTNRATMQRAEKVRWTAEVKRGGGRVTIAPSGTEGREKGNCHSLCRLTGVVTISKGREDVG